MKQFYIRVQDKQSTAGLTNLGVIDVPEEMREFVDYFDVLMGQPFSLRTNCAVGSFGDTLSINLQVLLSKPTWNAFSLGN